MLDKMDPDRANASPMDVETDEVCWICLDENKGQQDLLSPCHCPRKVHPRCMARWQLQQAGRAEETHCRFCNSTLADWKASLTPDALKPEVEKVQPIMVVYFEGEIHRIPVRQGDEGLKEFTTRIRELFKLPTEVDISLTFGCKEPMSGHHLKLEGMGAFDAAVHCASVAAAERQHKAGQRYTGNGTRMGEEGAESSDEGEDTTDLLQSTLGGPIQRPPGARAAALAAAVPPPTPTPVTPRPRLDSSRVPHSSSTPRNNNNANVPPSSTPPAAPARAPSTRSATAAQRHINTGHNAGNDSYAGATRPMNGNNPIEFTTPSTNTARRSAVAEPPNNAHPHPYMHPHHMMRHETTAPYSGSSSPALLTPSHSLYANNLNGSQDFMTNIPNAPLNMFSPPTRSYAQDRIRELERHAASRIPSGSHSPASSSPGGDAFATPTPALAAQADDPGAPRRVRRTSSRNQRAMAEAAAAAAAAGHHCSAGADCMDLDPPAAAHIGKSNPGALNHGADGTSSSAGMLTSVGNKRAGPPGGNYDVAPNMISRSKLNQVLSFFGIRPPAQITLGSTMEMDDS